jgi:hypothetical protein
MYSVAKKDQTATNAMGMLSRVSKELISVFPLDPREIAALSKVMHVFVKEMKAITATMI